MGVQSGSRPGRLLVLSGPSGCGKSTLARRLAADPGNEFSVSATTRRARPGEKDGVDYRFVTPEEFRLRADNGEFAEWKEVFGNFYGTPRRPLEAALAAGRNVIVEIDVQGALELKKQYPDGMYVFVLPPSEEELRRRLVSRNTENKDDADRRLRKAAWEMSFQDQYTHRIVNDDLDTATTALRALLAESSPKDR